MRHEASLDLNMSDNRLIYRLEEIWMKDTNADMEVMRFIQLPNSEDSKQELKDAELYSEQLYNVINKMIGDMLARMLDTQ